MITLRIAFRNLLASPRRTLFLGGALFGVTLLFVVLLSLAAGVTDNLMRAATNISSGHLNIGGFYKSTPTDASPIVQGVAQLKAEAKEALPDAVRVIDRMRGWGKIISDQGTVQTGINGVDFDDEGQLFSMLVLAPAKDYVDNPPDPEATKGSLADVKKPGALVLFASQARRLKVDVGDAVTIRTETLKGVSNTADATVVAVVRDLGLLSSFATFVPKATVAGLYQFKPDVSGVIQIYLDDIKKADDAVGRLRTYLDKKGRLLLDRESQPFFMKQLQTVPNEDWVGTKLDVTSWEDEASFLTQIISALRATSFSLILILAIVIVVGITNTMTIAVRERTREIGTLRAIGMQRGGILRLFLTEALLLGGLSTTAGAITGAALVWGIDALHIRIDVDAVRVILLSDTLHLVPRLSDCATAVILLTLVSGLAALLPSLRAARITPVTAMQSAG